METLSTKVKFLPVTVKLHWPDEWCPWCGVGMILIDVETYQCPSCTNISAGKTQYIGAEMRKA